MRSSCGDAIIIDEAPSLLDREEYAACPFEAGGLSKFYNLAPTEEEGVSRIIHKRGFPEPPERWRKFHQLALTGEAKCDLNSWDDLDHRADAWSAWRLWDVLKLDGVFGEVIFLADAFDQSEAFALMSLSKGVRFQSFRGCSAARLGAEAGDDPLRQRGSPGIYLLVQG